MPQFHFDIHTTFIARDKEGVDFPDLEAAKVCATAGALSLVIEEMRRDRRFSPNHSIKITNAAGQVLHTARYGDCVAVRV